VAEEAEYLMEVHLAAIQSGGTFLIQVGDVSADTLESVSSGSWLTTTAVSQLIYLNAGEQVMRFSVIGEPLYNIDRITFSLPGAMDTRETGTTFSAFLYPGRQLGVRINENRGPHSIRILDIQGKPVLHHGELGPGCLLISDPLRPGIYVVQAISGSGIVSRKVAIP
jgi:hypothetical protein